MMRRAMLSAASSAKSGGGSKLDLALQSLSKRQVLLRPLANCRHQDESVTSNEQKRRLGLAAVAAATTLVAAGSCSAVTTCQEDVASSSPTNDDTKKEKENPLWPSGVPPEMVKDYVDAIVLQNPEINISAIPDSVERLIYVSTVRLTLNALYEGLSTLHGQEVLGHEIVLQRRDSNKVLDLQHSTGKIDAQQLDELTDRLLKNKAVNQRWLPDFVERQVYSNCLKLVFSLLDKVADTLSIRLCGHQLSLSFEPLQEALQLTEPGQPVANALAENKPMVIDVDILEALVAETIKESKEADGATSILSYLPFYESFIINLHKTLYTLILGILGDMLAQTELAVLEDRVQIRLVPMDMDTWRSARDQQTKAQQTKIAELERQLQQAHDAESRARNLAALGLLTAAVTTIVAAIMQLED